MCQSAFSVREDNCCAADTSLHWLLPEWLFIDSGSALVDGRHIFLNISKTLPLLLLLRIPALGWSHQFTWNRVLFASSVSNNAKVTLLVYKMSKLSQLRQSVHGANFLWERFYISLNFSQDDIFFTHNAINAQQTDIKKCLQCTSCLIAWRCILLQCRGL